MRAYSVGNNKEDNGNFTASYYLRYDELTNLDYAIDELIAYWNMWADDDREDVRKDALEQIANISALGAKIELYRKYAFDIREEEE